MGVFFLANNTRRVERMVVVGIKVWAHVDTHSRVLNDACRHKQFRAGAALSGLRLAEGPACSRTHQHPIRAVPLKHQRARWQPQHLHGLDQRNFVSEQCGQCTVSTRSRRWTWPGLTECRYFRDPISGSVTRTCLTRHDFFRTRQARQSFVGCDHRRLRALGIDLLAIVNRSSE